jgi:hypothetical protein
MTYQNWQSQLHNNSHPHTEISNISNIDIKTKYKEKLSLVNYGHNG